MTAQRQPTYPLWVASKKWVTTRSLSASSAQVLTDVACRDLFGQCVAGGVDGRGERRIGLGSLGCGGHRAILPHHRHNREPNAGAPSGRSGSSFCPTAGQDGAMQPEDRRAGPEASRPHRSTPPAPSRPDYGQPATSRAAGDRRQPTGAARPKDAGRKAAEISKKAAGGTFRMARKASTSSGAGESGLYRLIELHAFNAAGDAALAVSLAGTLFFAVPSDEARGQIALFLLHHDVAVRVDGTAHRPLPRPLPPWPPMGDRRHHGAAGARLLVLAGAVEKDSNWMYIAALICLISSKAYGVTRASAVPRVIPEGLTLVKANSRISVAGIAGATISAPIAAVAGADRTGVVTALRAPGLHRRHDPGRPAPGPRRLVGRRGVRRHARR